MTETFVVHAEKREKTKKSARASRANSRVPGVVYGKKFAPVAISVGASEILRVFRRAGQSSLVDLDLDGKKIKVLIHEVCLHPVQNTIHHIDFFAVNLKEKTTVSVPLKFVGESPAVRNLGGIFTSEHDSVEIRCLPTEIPHEIEIDISKLENLHDHFSVGDIVLPENLELMHLAPETVICSIAAPRIVDEHDESSEQDEGEGDSDEQAGNDSEKSE